jgi:hypothetical protein
MQFADADIARLAIIAAVIRIDRMLAVEDERRVLEIEPAIPERGVPLAGS